MLKSMFSYCERERERREGERGQGREGGMKR